MGRSNDRRSPALLKIRFRGEPPQPKPSCRRNYGCLRTAARSAFAACDDKVGTGDEGADPSFYRLRIDGEQTNAVWIAVVNPATRIVLREKQIHADLDGDGVKEFFRACFSNEGVHHQVWTGAELRGTPRWHWYYYAGYDLEYNCTEREYFGAK